MNDPDHISLYPSEDGQEMHRDIKEEVYFIRRASSGDISAIKKNIQERRFRDLQGTGLLSVDPVCNLKYHMVVTTAILTRACIQKGMPIEEAFRLSDYYIRKLDYANTEDAVETIHDEMVLYFTGRMRLVLNDKMLSHTIRTCIDYIYAHLSERITVRELAEFCGVSATFLSKSFAQEMGISISDYIRERKIEASQDMLVNTEMSILEISCNLAFSSQSHFISAFKAQVGTTPKQYRIQHTQARWITPNPKKDRERFPYIFD